jgi:general secretion pathway protein N
MRRERFSHVLLIALVLSAPAFAYTASGVDDAANPGADNPGLDVTRHAMPPPDVTAKPAEAPTVIANPLWAIPLSALTATRARPLFTPSRRAPAPVVASVPVAAPRPAPPPALPQHPNLTLVGTVAGETEGIAVFVDPTTRDTVRLRTGEGHSGWILQSVERNAATLQKGGQTDTLALPRAAAVAAPAPVISTLPPPPPPPPQSNASPPAPQNAPPAQGCMPEPVGC